MEDNDLIKEILDSDDEFTVVKPKREEEIIDDPPEEEKVVEEYELDDNGEPKVNEAGEKIKKEVKEEKVDEEYELDDDGEPKLDDDGNKIKKEAVVEEEDDDEKFVDNFNKKFDTGYKSKEEIDALKGDIKNLASYKSSAEKVKDFEIINAENLRLKSENQDLKDMYDPDKIFVSKSEYNRQQLLRKYPEYDPSVITKIINTDINKMSPQQAIVLQTLLVNGDIYKNEQEVSDMFEDEHGISLADSLDDLESVKRNKVLMAAKSAKALFAEFYKEPENEGGVDILAAKEKVKAERAEGLQKAKEDWETFTVDIHKLVTDVTVAVKDGDKSNEFTYKLGVDFRKELSEKASEMAGHYAERGYEFNDKSKQGVIAELKQYFIQNNFDKIVSSFVSDGIAKYVESQEEGRVNPRKKEKAAPKKPKTDIQKQHADADAKMEKYFGL